MLISIAMKHPLASAMEVPKHKYKGIRADYPNHVWSADLTVVKRWRVWPTYILVIVDHYSRKILSAQPLEGPNAAWTVEGLQRTIKRYGKPRHIITDQGSVFTSNAFKDFLRDNEIKHRLGAVGKYGSIAVTERAIQTLKYEWLHRVSLIKGFDHSELLCQDFLEWYNK